MPTPTRSAPGRPARTRSRPSNTYDADGHISLKTDASGNLLAAVKTNRNDDPAPNGGDPLITVLKRTGSAGAAGAWASHPVTSVTVGGTRPILVLDDVANEANVFLTSPEQAQPGPQAIYRRTAPLSTLNFGAASIGNALHQAARPKSAINDATSTKQRATAATGIIVEATNIPTRHYLHNCVGGPCPVRARCELHRDPDERPQAAHGPVHRHLDERADELGLGRSTTTARGLDREEPQPRLCRRRVVHGQADGDERSGSDIETKTNYIVVSNPPPPVANFTGTPTSGTAPLTVQFTDTSTNAPTSWAWDFDNNGTLDSTAKNPSWVYANPGTYSVKLTATNGGGSDVEIKTGYITVQQPPETIYKSLTPPFASSTRGRGSTRAWPAPSTANVPRTLNIAGANGIPANTIAITGNLTVVGQTRGGYLSITKTSTANPASSVLNFPAGDTRANGVTVPLNGTGDLWIVYKAPGGSTAHVLLDVTGYFRVAADGTTFYEKAPVRVLDSRFGIGLSGAFQPNVPKTLSIAGANGIPGGRRGDHRQPDGRRPDASRIRVDHAEPSTEPDDVDDQLPPRRHAGERRDGSAQRRTETSRSSTRPPAARPTSSST